MAEVGKFGDPLNPFSERAGYTDIDVAMDSRLHAGYYHTELMAALPEKAITERKVGEHTLLTSHITCHAPYAVESGLFLIFGITLSREHYTRAPVKLALGMMTTGNAVDQRWIQLMRPLNRPFGVAGLSSRDQNGNFEKWRSLTLVMGAYNNTQYSHLWGETVTHANPSFERLKDTGDGAFEDYHEAMWRALSRTIKRQFTPSSSSN